MQYFWDKINNFKKLLKSDRKIILFLDFDGTLVSVENNYQDSKINPEVRELLRKLKKIKSIYLTIVSGRKMADLRQKIGIAHITYSGTHGLEWRYNGKVHTQEVPKNILEIIGRIKKEIQKLLVKFPTLLIEDKKLTFALHYRNLSTEDLDEFYLLFKKITSEYLKTELITVIHGKKVYEIKPNIGLNKGTFCKHYIEKIADKNPGRPIVFCIGDDRTDEDMFSLLKNEITVKVGFAEKTSANYYFKDRGEVKKFLNWILENKS